MVNADAHALYQGTLDKVTQAIMAPDESLWEQNVQVPHFMSTSEGKMVNETREDLVASLHDYASALKKLGVTEMERKCDTARLTRKDVIVGFHTTKMFTSKGEALPPYPVRWVMQLNDGTWQVAHSNSALSSNEWQATPHVSLSQFRKRDCDAETARSMLMLTVLDRIDSIFMAGDFDGWFESVCLPFVFETRSRQGLFTSKESLRADFNLYQQEFKIHQVTELTRVVKSAEMIDDDMMLGTYRVHVLSGSHYVVAPWDGAMTLKLVDGRWRVTKIMGALGHLNWN